MAAGVSKDFFEKYAKAFDEAASSIETMSGKLIELEAKFQAGGLTLPKEGTYVQSQAALAAANGWVPATPDQVEAAKNSLTFVQGTSVSGDDTYAYLEAAIPGFMQMRAKHPRDPDGQEMPLRSIIVSLNDSYEWTREQVADWLETLDLDLTINPVDDAAMARAVAVVNAGETPSFGIAVENCTCDACLKAKGLIGYGGAVEAVEKLKEAKAAKKTAKHDPLWTDPEVQEEVKAQKEAKKTLVQKMAEKIKKKAEPASGSLVAVSLTLTNLDTGESYNIPNEFTEISIDTITLEEKK